MKPGGGARILLAAGLLVTVAVAALAWRRDWFRRAQPIGLREAWLSTRALRDQAARFASLEKAIRAGMSPAVGEHHLVVRRQRFAAVPADASFEERASATCDLVDSLLIAGNNEEALALLREPIEQARKLGEKRRLVPFLERRAIAHIRIGERRNCVSHHNAESCIFPLGEKAVHQDKEGSQAAARDLEELLAIDPGDYASIWLLNIVHMTLGTYPDGVPGPFRIDPSKFASEHDIGRMREIAAPLGMNTFSHAGGAIMDDFNGDGLLDVLTSSMDPSFGLRLFENRGDGRFEDVAKQRGISGHLGGLQLVHADVNDDGRLDFLVLRGGWLGPHGEMPNSLLVQDADGRFRDVTEQAGVEVLGPTQTAAFADIDNDGDLDLYIGYEHESVNPRANRFPGHLFRNRGDGTFEDVTERAGVANRAFCKGVTFGDYDGDRMPDLYVSNYREPNRLYRNNGDGTFTDVAEKLGVDRPIQGFPTWFFDYDNDGRLDLFASRFLSDDANREIGAYYKDGKIGEDTCHLYENDGRGGFRDVTVERRLDRVFFPMGSSFGDVDNDGWPDIYLATGNPDLSSLWPNIMLRNDRGERFQDVTASSGTGHLQKGHGVAFGDLDRDGDQDLFVQMGGAYRDDAFWDALFENPGHGNHWLTVQLVGRASNRFGVGARVRVRIEEPAGSREVYGFGGANGSFGGNSLQLELGLGQARRIEFVEVFWPTTGRTQRFADVPLDLVIRIDEDAAAIEVVPARSIRLAEVPAR